MRFAMTIAVWARERRIAEEAARNLLPQSAVREALSTAFLGVASHMWGRGQQVGASLDSAARSALVCKVETNSGNPKTASEQALAKTRTLFSTKAWTRAMGSLVDRVAPILARTRGAGHALIAARMPRLVRERIAEPHRMSIGHGRTRGVRVSEPALEQVLTSHRRGGEATLATSLWHKTALASAFWCSVALKPILGDAELGLPRLLIVPWARVEE